MQTLQDASLKIAVKAEAKMIARALLADDSLRIAVAAAKVAQQDLQDLAQLSIAI